MLNEKAICWDLDDTLGNFKRLMGLFGHDVPEYEYKLGLKFGIKKLLTELTSKGYKHFVTTSASAEYAKLALEKSNLIDYFEEIFSRSQVSNLDNYKQYMPVANAMGFSVKQAKSNLIIIGNAPLDRPGDLINSVFINHHRGWSIDSYVTGEIIEELIILGQGNFRKGFDKMYKLCENITKESGNKTYNISQGIDIDLLYDTPGIKNCNLNLLPTITNINAPNFEKETTKFKPS